MSRQKRALAYGFRPADVTIAVSAPIDAAHGVDPNEPKTTLQVPRVDVMDATLKLWHEHKKLADMALVLDTSGSMKGRPLRNAKQGAEELLQLLGDRDRLSLLQFSDKLRWLGEPRTMKSGKQFFAQQVQSLIPDGGTALYDAIAEAHEKLTRRASPDRITAVVVLTDGADRNSRMKLRALLRRIQFDNEGRPVRVFTIGYGKNANERILKQIAAVSQGKYFKGTTKNIREVFKEISTFF